MIGDREKEAVVGGMVLKAWLKSWRPREAGVLGSFWGLREQSSLEAGGFPAAAALGQLGDQASRVLYFLTK